MVVSGDSVLVDGFAALARMRRSALRIHDPRVLFTAAPTPAQVDGLVVGIRSDAATAARILGGTDETTAATLARLGAAQLDTTSTPAVRAWARDVAGAAARLIDERVTHDPGGARAVDDRVRILVRQPGPLTPAERDELAVLVEHAGARDRLGLVELIRRDAPEQGRFQHVLSTSPDHVVERLRAAWRAQATMPNEAIARRAAQLLDEHGITADTAPELRTLLVDLDAARALRLPAPGRGIGDPLDVLDRLVAGDPGARSSATRLELFWRRARTDAGLPGPVQLDSEVRARLASELRSPADAIELLHVTHDLGGAAVTGAELHEPTLARILEPIARYADGWSTLDDAQVARTRLLTRIDDDAARQVAAAAVSRARSSADGDLTALRAAVEEPVLRAMLPSRDHLALLAPAAPRSFDEVRPWLTELDSVLGEVDGIPADLRTRIDELRSRATAFLDGAPPGDKAAGYRGHPDYAELGSLAQHLRLADAITPRADGIAAVAHDGVTITW